MGEVMKAIALLLAALLALAAPIDVPAQEVPSLQHMTGADRLAQFTAVGCD